MLLRQTKYIAVAFLLSGAMVVSPLPSFAQQPQGSVSVVTLKVVHTPGGQKVMLPSRQQVPLPGAGVNGRSVDIYMGGEGGYWYVDKNGENFDLTPYVEKITVNQSDGSSNSNNESSNSNDGGSDAAAAAGAGAMAGAAAGAAYNEYQSEYQVPYGFAVVGGGAAGQPYYTGADGNNVNINSSNSTNISPYTDNLRKQEQWYQQQRDGNPRRFQQASGMSNPFVNKAQPASRGPFAGGPPGGGMDASQGRGPFGGHGPFGGQGGGGPFAGKSGPPGMGSTGTNGFSGPPSGGPFGGKGGPPGMGGGANGFSGPRSGGPPAGGPSGKMPAGGPPSGGPPGGRLPGPR